MKTVSRKSDDRFSFVFVMDGIHPFYLYSNYSHEIYNKIYINPQQYHMMVGNCSTAFKACIIYNRMF